MGLPAPTPLETVVLASGDATVYVAPERGGMVTRFFVGDRPILYLDEATLVDRTKNVRGGNPVLFPSPGKLAHDRFSYAGRSGEMGQHGFARNEPWEVAARTSHAVTLRLAANDRTRAVFPWDFVATYTYALRSNALEIAQRIETRGAEQVPFALGFHPYFFVRDGEKARTRIPTRATRAWDNAAKSHVAIDGPIDLTAAEVDLHLVDHGNAGASLALAHGHHVELRGAYPRWVVWTLRGKDFVCLEPWSAPADALNTREGLLGATRDAPVEKVLEIAFT